jgi:hypothetical protein
MSEVRVTYYGKSGNKKIAFFKINKESILELVETKDYVSPIKIDPDIQKKLKHEEIQKQIKPRIGFGEVVASFTKLFGFKPCAPCNKRRQYLNRITPIFIANIIGKFYK